MDLSNVLKHAELEKVLTKLSEINILWGSDYNTTLANLVNLLLMTGLKKKHYTAIENLSRLISRKNTNFQKLTITVIEDESQSYTECINQHIPSRWSVYSKLPYGDVLDPLKIYPGNGCVERIIHHKLTPQGFMRRFRSSPWSHWERYYTESTIKWQSVVSTWRLSMNFQTFITKACMGVCPQQL